MFDLTRPVEVSLWLFVILLFLATWAALSLLLIPSVRWFLRRRVNRIIDEVNTRLQLKIRPFTLTKRQVLIDRLVYDPMVMEAVDNFAAAENRSRQEVLQQVKRYAGEIVPAFNAYIYFRFGYSLARNIARRLYRVRLGYADPRLQSSIDPEATIVFVMNHRSNMDYVLVAFLAAERTTMSYAVGEWARVWPLQNLIRAMGAYFVRRNSNNPLYRRVLERYVHMATSGGVPQAVFPEGGLSRDGKLREPRLGLLDYMLRHYDMKSSRDIVFVPVGINYDRVLEDRTLLSEKDPQLMKGKGGRWALMGFIWRNVRLKIQQRWDRFGYACVNFGSPVSLKRYLVRERIDPGALEKEERMVYVRRLADRLMGEIGQVIPVVPVTLLAKVLLENEGRKLSAIELKAQVLDYIQKLEEKGAHLFIPRQNLDYSLQSALRMLSLRHLIEEKDGEFALREKSILQYYANSIAHFFEEA